MNNQATTYKWLSVGLALVVIVLGALWLSSRNTPELITQNFQTSLTHYKDEIRAKCTFTSTTTSDQRRDCEATLAGLSDTLREYRNDMEDATGTSTLPIGGTATTTMQ